MDIFSTFAGEIPMTMELELYRTALILAGAVNLLIAVALLHNNIYFRIYDVYHRSRTFVALNYTIFGIGFLLHAYFCWRITWPEAASALTVSYFHSGGVLFGWSHISLMSPDYLSKKRMVCDLAILAIGVTTYWTILSDWTFAIFFIHASYIAFTFYHTYFQVRRNIKEMPADEQAPYWWTAEAKRTVLGFHHSFVIGCHLIVLFGLGSIAITASFPHDIWPYSLLTLSGVVVFSFIFYSLVEYGNVIDAATNATEDASKGKKVKMVR
jgi:hypothetical protein